MLSRPTWSVRSLLPTTSPSEAPSSTTTTTTTNTTSNDDPTITRETLSHLLRLSALPQPASEAEAASLLQTLEAQLAFVRAVRDVDTSGVEPLRAIRDETAAGRREQTVGLEALRDALAREDVVGHARRPRRRRKGRERQQGEEAGEVGAGTAAQEDPRVPGVEDWDVLAGASETAGPYFVVRSGGAGAKQNGADGS